MPALPPGPYKVGVEFAGFESSVVNQVEAQAVALSTDGAAQSTSWSKAHIKEKYILV